MQVQGTSSLQPVLVDPVDAGVAPIGITRTAKQALEPWLAEQPERIAAWVRAMGFSGEPGTTLLIPGEDGRPDRVLLGTPPPEPGRPADPWAYGGLPFGLPEGTYALGGALEGALEGATADGETEAAAFGWAVGAYRYARYHAVERDPARLVWPADCDRARVDSAVASTVLVRDLINTPANDLGPAELADAAMAVAAAFGAEAEVIVGDDLLDRNYPTIHAVGRASVRAPRLIDLRWGPVDAPKVTVIGKGVCFDSGGLDLKASGAMLLMKKDMGGAAHALGLARMIMAADLPVRLRVLIPAVENAVSGAAFRPLDVIRTRKGITVEIGNTDAEGRLILCDALAEAGEEHPDLMIDFATLTGAARVALGPDLPALFSNDDSLADAMVRASRRTADPIWRLPLWTPYERMLRSSVAEVSNTGDAPFAGAITAALFLQRFVDAKTPWMHLDIFGWNPADRPGRPKGGEAAGMRAAFAMIAERFAG